jgi:DnaJ-class molecular chaperone
MRVVNKAVPKQALRELQTILRQPYQDACNVCRGTGKVSKDAPCPKCKGSGKRLLRLL